jgi:hypothetical protein
MIHIMAKRHPIDPCRCTEAATARLGFPFHTSMIARSLI